MIATKSLRDMLTTKLVARLAMRWPQAAAYVSPGSALVHCPGQLADDDRVAFDSYVLGYQDAIEDVVRHTAGAAAEPQPYAMSLAESSLFQGGTPPPTRQARHGHRRTETAEGRDARQELEKLFSGGGDG